MGPRLLRILFNLYPPYLVTRTRVVHIAPDWKRVVVKLKRSLLNRNYVGTIFGGSIYAAANPHFMIMLIHILGIKDYIVWDQASTVVFKRPARSTLTMDFVITDEMIKTIQETTAAQGKIRPEFTVDAVDEAGEVCATIQTTVYIRRKM